jgi:uncharacterized membrane protein YgdD (TMEM256/DUF423 family)
MKLGKLSLIAALAMTTGAFASDAVDKAVDSMKVNGQVKLWYQTMDHGGVSGDDGLFNYDSATGANNEWGNMSATLKVTGDANDHISYGVALMGVTTMGLENHVVTRETAEGSFSAGGTNSQPFWFHEAFINYKTGNTNIKIGRQELDTPLAFTEKWNATANSFEAAVVVNSDVPDTTLVAAYVAKGNGAGVNAVAGSNVFGTVNTYNSYMGYADVDTRGGAVAVGAINKSLSFMPIQVWGYHIPQVANALWAQADASVKDMGPLNQASLQLIAASIGTQGKTEDVLKTLGKTDDTQALAAKVAVGAGMFSAYAAFSQTSEGNIPVANTATNYKKTKLPTASIFSDGMVAAQPDTTAFKVGAGAKFDGIGTLAVSYGSYTVGKNDGYFNPVTNSTGTIAHNSNKDIDATEIDVVFKTKIKDIDLAAMYIGLDNTYVPGGVSGTEKNDIVRLVATLNF